MTVVGSLHKPTRGNPNQAPPHMGTTQPSFDEGSACPGQIEQGRGHTVPEWSIFENVDSTLKRFK